MRVRFFNKMNIFVYMGMVSSKKKFAALTYTAFQWWIKKNEQPQFLAAFRCYTRRNFYTQRQTDRHKQTHTKSDSGYQTPLLCTRFEFQNQIILSGNRTLSYQVVLSFICYQCFYIFLYLLLLLVVVLICCCCFFLFFQFTKISVAFIWNSEFNIN